METEDCRSAGRPRGQKAASEELARMSGVELARWGAAACAGGLTQRSAAKLAGVSRRHLQRLLSAHADDPAVQRDQLLADAIGWERQGARTLAEACSRAAEWMRSVSNNPNADTREVAAAFAATVAASHRLAEIGSRRARRLQPQEQPQTQRFDLQGFLSTVATACSEIRQQLPPDQQGQAFEQLHQQLRSDQQGQADPIDVQVIEAQEPDPPTCPL